MCWSGKEENFVEVQTIVDYQYLVIRLSRMCAQVEEGEWSLMSSVLHYLCNFVVVVMAVSIFVA